MEDQVNLLKSYLKGVWLSKRFILIFAWIVCPIGWFAVAKLPNQYTSDAVVYADTNSILKPLLRGLTIQTDPSQKLRLMANTLLSSKNIEIISNEIDAEVLASNKEEYDQLLKELKNGIKIKSTNKNNLYTISFTGDEPLYVRDVVQSALNVFIESTLGDQRLDTAEAQNVINDQIALYESRLIEAEKKLADFKRENLGLMPSSGNNYYSTLENEKRLLENAEFNSRELKSRIDDANQQLNNLTTLSSNQLNNVTTEYDDRINAIAIRLDELRLRFTERYPDVIESRSQLKELTRLKAIALQNINVDDVFQANPIYRDLKIKLNSFNNEYASLEVRIDRHKNRILELQEKLNYIPDVEAMLTSLTRDYNITKGKYEDLLSRREKASILSNVENVSEDIKFRIIEPPSLPTSASGPNRLMYYLLVLFLGVGSGLALAVVNSLVKPVVSSVYQVQKEIGIPVIGVVSVTSGSGLLAKTRNNNLAFFFFSFALLALLALFISNKSLILLNLWQ